MFFDRSGLKSQCFSAETDKKQSSAPAPARRNWAALGLAAAMAAPFGVVQIAKLQAQEAKPEKTGELPASAVQPTSDELVRQAHTQFARRQFEEAAKTLASVKPTDVADADRAAFASFSLEVKNAALERRMARMEFTEGAAALSGKQHDEAVSHFKAVADNTFADETTLKTAHLRLIALGAITDEKAADAAVADATPTPASAPAVKADAVATDLTPKQRYELGVSQYRVSNWSEARVNLAIAQTSGYQPASIYQDAPADIIRRIDARAQIDRQPVQHLAQVQPADPLLALKATAEGDEVRHQQASAQAQQWVSQAKDAEQQKNYQQALKLYAQAVTADPTNSDAVQGRDKAAVATGQTPPSLTGNGTNDAAQNVVARQGEIKYQVSSNLEAARGAIQLRNWAEAKTAIDRARLAANIDPTIFSTADINGFRQQVDQTELELNRAKETYEAQAGREQAVAIDAQIRNAQTEAEKQKQRTIADLIRTSQSLINQGKYREALQTDEQILVLDPKNDYAVGIHPLLEDKVQFQTERQFREMRLRKTGSQFVNAEEALIPYDDILRYPTDWPDLSAMRDLTVAQEHGGGDSEANTVRQLARVLPTVQFDAVGFNDVVDFLRDISGANIFVNWKVLEAAGIDRNTPVTANVHNIKFSKALDLILDSVGGGQTKLGYTVDEGVFTISTQDDLSKNVVIRVYDIRDLLVSMPDFTDAPQLSLDQNQSQSGGGGGQALGQGGGGGGGIQQSSSLFGNGQSQGNNNKQIGPSRQDLTDSITKLIEDNVATESWKDNGGAVGSLRVFDPSGQLIVTQTPENHRQLVALLDRIREERGILVTVETRFLTVSRNYLEDVGVDLNFQFNLNNSWSKKFGSIPLQSPNSQFVQNPSTAVPGSLGSQITTPTGLTTSATYLDDFQVSLVMRAVEASVNSTVVTAPRVTLFNGQRAYVLVATSKTYVSNLTPVVSTGVSSFAPTPAQTPSGTLLDVQATVSADRKYVTMTLRPWVSNLLDLVPFTFQGGTTAQATGNGTVVNNVSSGTIQLPETSQTLIRTTVSVPDGGTLLLGGQTLAAEVTREVGVPVLSKIPYLKRLFTSKSVAKDESILLILVRPTIIMQREIEQKQFPLLTNRLSQ